MCTEGPGVSSSTDMLNLVASRRTSYNNQSLVARNWIFSRLKLIYYVIFAKLYGLVGKCSQVTMVNSSWTYNHIVELWGNREGTDVVYPPCDVEEFKKIQVS